MGVTVQVPATTANMGPGFDSLGCAFALYNRFTFELADVTSVHGCDDAFKGDDNLALVAFRETCLYAGVTPCAVKLTIDADIPVSSGLGSSASLLVGGAMGANRLLNLNLSKDDIYKIASRLEGHPDNIAPAVFGGLTAALTDENGESHVVTYPISKVWSFCAFTNPGIRISTKEARSVLPASYSRADAVFNGTHVALLPAVLMYGDIKLLPIVLQDKLHEPYRTPLIADYQPMMKSAKEAGAHAFFLSGSGPTCMAIYTDAEFPEKMKAAVQTLSSQWNVLPLAIDREGVTQIG